MVRPTLAQIKANFETGDVPDGAAYAQLIDTLAAQSTELGSTVITKKQFLELKIKQQSTAL